VNTLVDTTIWSLGFRRRSSDLSAAEAILVAELRELVKEGRAHIIGVIRQELLSGIRTQGQYEKLRELLRDFLDEPVDSTDHEEAAKCSNDCRSKGIVVDVVDILICSIAIRRDWTIFTTDPDFKNYAKILPIKMHEPRKFSK
jgi:predicted nucleic acid-binding protein